MPSESAIETKFNEIFEDLAPIKSMYPDIIQNLKDIQQAFHGLYIRYDQKCLELRGTEEAWARTIIESVEAAK